MSGTVWALSRVAGGSGLSQAVIGGMKHRARCIAGVQRFALSEVHGRSPGRYSAPDAPFGRCVLGGGRHLVAVQRHVRLDAETSYVG
ncbi:protein of unknown function [Burkholderia multivorans]